MELQKLYVTLMLDAADFKTGMAAVTGAVAVAAAATVAAVGAVAIEGVKAAMDMEQQMANIAAVMGKTKAEVEPLGDLIKDLGLDLWDSRYCFFGWLFNGGCFFNNLFLVRNV